MRSTSTPEIYSDFFIFSKLPTCSNLFTFECVHKFSKNTQLIIIIIYTVHNFPYLTLISGIFLTQGLVLFRTLWKVKHLLTDTVTFVPLCWHGAASHFCKRLTASVTSVTPITVQFSEHLQCFPDYVTMARSVTFVERMELLLSISTVQG
jgi:hypothetical protein